VAGPERTEKRADQLDEPRVVGVGADRFAEAGHQPGRSGLPVGEHGLFSGVEEEVPQPVRAGYQAR